MEQGEFPPRTIFHGDVEVTKTAFALTTASLILAVALPAVTAWADTRHTDPRIIYQQQCPEGQTWDAEEEKCVAKE